MGFLDHTTNNIIVDAVLTDKGREKLASSNGLKIIQYSFADTEVDYTLLKKYGEIVGREKIEKNTPIFEADTSGWIPDKHTLLQDATAGNVQTISLTSDGPVGPQYVYQMNFSGFDASQNLVYEIVWNSLYYNSPQVSGGQIGNSYPIGDPAGILYGIQATATATPNGTHSPKIAFTPAGSGNRVASFSVNEQGGASSGVIKTEFTN